MALGKLTTADAKEACATFKARSEIAPIPPFTSDIVGVPRSQQHRDLTRVPATTTSPNTAKTRVHDVLSDDDSTRICALLERKKIADPQLASVTGSRFVLHDTAGSFNIARPGLQSLADSARGPLGKEGTSAYVPSSGSPVNAYAPFEKKRVTSSKYEKAIEKGMTKTDLSGRENALRAVWKAASKPMQDAALEDALSSLDSAKYVVAIDSEKKKATTQLNGSGEITTTAIWAIEAICKNSSANDAVLSACAKVGFLKTREERVSSSVNIEITQNEGSNCEVPAQALKTYNESQYDNVALLYLTAAVAASQYPEVTTHYLLDHDLAGGHCDPRCFKLGHLYELIAGYMSHPAGTLYGVEPRYGITAGKSTNAACNIWWDNKACSGAPPGDKSSC